jgi:hypothetical protein
VLHKLHSSPEPPWAKCRRGYIYDDDNRPDGGGSKKLWNVGKLIADDTAQQSRRKTSSSIHNSPFASPKYRFNSKLLPRLALKPFAEPQGSVGHSLGITELFKPFWWHEWKSVLQRNNFPKALGFCTPHWTVRFFTSIADTKLNALTGSAETIIFLCISLNIHYIEKRFQIKALRSAYWCAPGTYRLYCTILFYDEPSLRKLMTLHLHVK